MCLHTARNKNKKDEKESWRRREEERGGGEQEKEATSKELKHKRVLCFDETMSPRGGRGHSQM
jgi:hypothetical protein